MKEMMKNPLASKQPQLKDDLSVFPQEQANKYKFFLQLFGIVRQTGQKVMSNDPAVVKEIYHSQKQNFSWPNDERTAVAAITEFFSPAEFLKRLNIHREYVCKSKTKK